jgi:hypothetical protein
MIRTDSSNGKSVKELKKKQQKEEEEQLRQKCAALANEKYGEEEVKKMSNQHKGLFFLPVMNEEGEIEKLALLKPIDRHILSYASTKIEDEGLYEFLGAVMRECWIVGDKEIQDDDEYFIPAAGKIQKILDGKKAALLKR